MHQKKIFDFFFFFFFFGQPAELTAFFVRQIFLHLPELIWIWNILRRQQATPKILSEWWFFRADVPAPAQAPAGWLCWCWDVLLPWVVQKSLGQEKNTYMFTASGCLAFQLIIGQGKAHWFAVSVGVFVVHEQKESIWFLLTKSPPLAVYLQIVGFFFLKVKVWCYFHRFLFPW